MGSLSFTPTLIFFLVVVYGSSSHATTKTTTTTTTNDEFERSFRSKPSIENNKNRRVIDVHGAPDSVVWVVQLSDIHFSVHHPDRALDFLRFVGPTLSFINPSLVLITGDLTDGKSKDMLTMKVNEAEWREYQKVMEEVIKKSGLDKSLIFDLRGNHDNFGVPELGASLDFFSKYSINGQLGRTKNINSVTLQTFDRKHLFVGVDTTGDIGLRGPTNLFGHPTDELLDELDSELSQWDSESTKAPTKISFGHFPISFSAPSSSGKSLKDVFVNHSVSAYLCGHLHTKFGKNLKRHHRFSDKDSPLQSFFQFNPRQPSYEDTMNCSVKASPVKEFWEWEMGDWRKSRAMRILAIDRGHVSYVDFDFKSGDEKTTIVVPTFPLDSRFMSTSSCRTMVPSSYESIRALLFSSLRIVSVVAKVYDSNPGNLNLVFEAEMNKISDKSSSRGDFYFAPWNYKAFEDPSPDRYWLQIEVTDITGKLTLTDPRPFSTNGLSSKVSWTWLEVQVMGTQWSTIYFPLLWSTLCFMFAFLLIPKALLIFSKRRFNHKDFIAQKTPQNYLLCVFFELSKLSMVWFGLLGYLFYLILFPWFIGKVFAEGDDLGYMTYRGWVVRSFHRKEKLEFIGFPDIMVVVVSHIFFVVLPCVIVTAILAAERVIYREHFLSVTGKKEDDKFRDGKSRSACVSQRWVRKVLLLVCLAIFWKHFKNCRALVKAYEMNPIIHCPVYCFTMPLLLAFTVYRTGLL